MESTVQPTSHPDGHEPSTRPHKAPASTRRIGRTARGDGAASPASKTARSARTARDAQPLAEVLSPLIRAEIAGIAAIDTALAHEKHPGYVVLFQDARTTKQASVEQMSVVLRRAGLRPQESGGLMQPVLRLQSAALSRMSTTALLRALRTAEQSLLARYADGGERLGDLARETLAHHALASGMRRARKRHMILTAHIERRENPGTALADDLPLPLTQYLAGEEDKVCMRCLLDRRGSRPALERQDPYTYLCAACHQETEAAFPADLAQQMPRWPEKVRQDRVIQKALGRPMKLVAEKTVHARLAGLEPDEPVVAQRIPAETTAQLAAAGRAHRRTRPPRSILTVPDTGASPGEKRYTDLLFDFRSVRRSW